MKNLQTLSAVGFILLMVTGCASSGVLQNIKLGMNSISVSHDCAVVETTGVPVDNTSNVPVIQSTHGKEIKTTSMPADTTSPERELNALILSGLQSSGRLGNVTGNANAPLPSAGIKVAVKIESISQVSEGERQFLGALAGRAHIKVQVEVSDLATGSQIETFEAEGKSSGGTIFAGTTDQAIQLCANQVVAEVLKICDR